MLQKFRQIVFPLGLASFIFAALSWDIGSRLQPLPPVSGHVLSKDNGAQVYIEAKTLSHDETADYVHRDLLSRGYQPVLLQIDNTSPFSYEIKRDYVGIPTESAKKIVSEIGKSSIPRMVAYKVLGFLFWPLAIPGTIDTVRTWNKEFELTRELEAKTIKPKGEIIPPYASISRVLYIPKNELKETFQVALTNIERQQVEDFFLLIEAPS